jgi:nitroreductase
MDTLETILTRRSIRQFTAQPVPDSVLEGLLRAGMSAPSAGNQQPWHFVVITDRQTLDTVPSIHPHSAMLKQAPLAILVCGDDWLETNKGYWVQDCSAATQNILLAVHASGLGGVWLGIYPRQERVEAFRRLLGLPQHVTPLSLIAVGYPAERVPPADRYDTSRVHHNKW